MFFIFSDKSLKGHNSTPNKLKTHHYVAPEFRRQGSLQRKACDINFDDLKIPSPSSPISDELTCHPESRASVTHSTPRPNSRAALFYPKEFTSSRNMDNIPDHVSEWDSASYV